MSPGYTINIKSKVKGQDHSVTKCKNISGDRVVGVSLHSIECPASFINILPTSNLNFKVETRDETIYF